MMKRLTRRIIDLRSDTVTKPCDRMREAMAQAEVGDVVWGDDPTVNSLESFAAELLGKEKALFVPSGTMGNLLCLAAQCRRGDEVILGKDAHIFKYEGAGASAYLGVGLHPIETQSDGSFALEDIENAIRADDPHYPRTRLVALENTHNVLGGKALDVDTIDAIGDFCKSRDLKLHMDGARLANAAVKLNRPLKQLIRSVDSVSFCLSKGLGAPVGSIVAGTHELIYHASRARKSLGGGWRQAGLLAAAGLFALENNFDRLVDDHRLAFVLATELASMPGVHVDLTSVETNIVYFDIVSSHVSKELLLLKLRDKGILLGGGYGTTKKFRAVVHLNVSSQDIATVLETIEKLVDPAAIV